MGGYRQRRKRGVLKGAGIMMWKKFITIILALLLLCVPLRYADADVDITIAPLNITLVHIETENRTSEGNEVKFEVKFTGGVGPYTCIMGLYNSQPRLIDETYIGPADTDGFGWYYTITESGDYCIEAIIMDNAGEMASSYPNWMHIDGGTSLDITNHDDSSQEIVIPSSAPSNSVDITVSSLQIDKVKITNQQQTANGCGIDLETSVSGGVPPYTGSIYLFDYDEYLVGDLSIPSTSSGRFQGSCLIAKSGKYRVEAEVRDATGEWAFSAPVWIEIYVQPPVSSSDTSRGGQSSYQSAYDITIAPLEVTQVYLSSTNQGNSVNQACYIATCKGGEPPYSCDLKLIDSDGAIVDTISLQKQNDTSFQWTTAVRQEGSYMVEVAVTDASGETRYGYSDWNAIHIGNSLDITASDEKPRPTTSSDNYTNYYDITLQPLQVTKVWLSSSSSGENAKQLHFMATCEGGMEDYVCAMMLIDADGAKVDSVSLARQSSREFRWTTSVRHSGRYMLKATVEDSAGESSVGYSDWIQVEVGSVLELSPYTEEPQPQDNRTAEKRSKRDRFLQRAIDEYVNVGKKGAVVNPYGYNDQWCARFVSYVATEAKVKDEMVSLDSHCTQLAYDYARAGLYYNTSGYEWKSQTRKDAVLNNDLYLASVERARSFSPLPGDLVVYETIGSWSDGPDHVGIVVAVKGNQIEVIEGNADGGRLKKYTKSWQNGANRVHGFCRPYYNVD